MADILQKMRAARQRVVDIDGHKITIRRPTPMEWLAVPDYASAEFPDTAGMDDDQARAARQAWFSQQIDLNLSAWREFAWHVALGFADAWDLREIDLIPGGVPEPVALSPDVLREWLSDRPAALNALAVAVLSAWWEYQGQREADQKSSRLVWGASPGQADQTSRATAAGGTDHHRRGAGADGRRHRLGRVADRLRHARPGRHRAGDISIAGRH
ncbi:hypothetical protein [Methylomonas sp. CM2]|uniref:hypothetical protein n=1 Tax=Methylomonas sp. CM2 TaxID=3417647 RepID=UPI003CF9CF1F